MNSVGRSLTTIIPRESGPKAPLRASSDTVPIVITRESVSGLVQLEIVDNAPCQEKIVTVHTIS